MGIIKKDALRTMVLSYLGLILGYLNRGVFFILFLTNNFESNVVGSIWPTPQTLFKNSPKKKYCRRYGTNFRSQLCRWFSVGHNGRKVILWCAWPLHCWILEKAHRTAGFAILGYCTSSSTSLLQNNFLTKITLISRNMKKINSWC